MRLVRFVTDVGRFLQILKGKFVKHLSKSDDCDEKKIADHTVMMCRKAHLFLLRAAR